MDATALALLLLGTYAATYCWQSRGAFQHAGGTQEIATLDILHERGDIDIHRTAFHTGGFCAVQTTVGLSDGLLSRQTGLHLFQTGGAAVGGVQLGHHHTFDGGALLGLHLLAQLLAPWGIAVGQFIQTHFFVGCTCT